LSAGAASEAALEALFVPFSGGELSLPADGNLLVLRARDGFALRENRRAGWVLQQSFKPAADALARSGFAVVSDGVAHAAARRDPGPVRAGHASRG
jgi:16S rRNA (guanine1207-N2)-methyltransferase